MPTIEDIERANRQETDRLASENRILRRENEGLKRDLAEKNTAIKEFGDRVEGFVDELRKAGL